MNSLRSDDGFSLVELAIGLIIITIILAMSIPAVQSMSNTYRLKGATENIAAQLRLAREKAIGVGVDQAVHFSYRQWTAAGTGWAADTSDYHLHIGTQFGARWALPRGITYASGNGVMVTMKKDGRADGSYVIALRDPKGNRDTVSVMLSGLVLTK
jgi:prepilin-type N-terminal cleavage/methylation domain-containing protein